MEATAPTLPRGSSGPEARTTTTTPSTHSKLTLATPSYFTFKDFLSHEEEATFFDWDHSAQVDKVAAYLAFVAEQPAAAQFTSSKRASTSWAELRSSGIVENEGGVVDSSGLNDLLVGRTKSGFGAFGSEDGFLPQRELSIAVAQSIEPIGHEYIVERNKTGEIRPRVLNSRSFYLNWCHAEKQKLMDIRLKLDRLGIDRSHRCLYWKRLTVVVDRVMCPDCIQYAHNLAVDEDAEIAIRDPTHRRLFAKSKHSPIVVVETSLDG